MRTSTGPAAETRNTAAGYLYDHTSDFVAESIEQGAEEKEDAHHLGDGACRVRFLLRSYIAQYDGEVEPLHGHTFQVTLRVSGEPNASGMVAEFQRDQARHGRRRRAAAMAHLVPGHSPELQITPENGSLSIACGAKRYLLPAEDVTVLPLTNITLEALAGYLLNRVLPQLPKTRLVAGELEVFEPPGTAAVARAQLG